jgi:hypothetical protein
MVKIKIGEKEVYYDGFVAEQFQHIRDNIIPKDWDWITFIDGMEGAGKSTLAQQLALLCDSTFNIDRIAFTPDEFKKAIGLAQKNQAVIFDEAYEGVASKDTLGEVVKSLCALLTQIRQKNLFVFILAPCFFDVTKYIALWRTKLLFHVYVADNYERGYFRLYTYASKNQLYIGGKKEYNYNVVHANAKGRFTKQYIVDDNEYKAKKLKALDYYISKGSGIEVIDDEDKYPTPARLRTKDQRNKLIQLVLDNELMSMPELEKTIGLKCIRNLLDREVVKNNNRVKTII